MSHVIISRWTPPAQDTQTPGWLPARQLLSMLESGNISPILAADSKQRPADEIMGICYNYLLAYETIATHVMPVVGEIEAYIWKSNDPRLVMTLMRFRSQDKFLDVQAFPGWQNYRQSQQGLLDVLGIRLERKSFEISTQDDWVALNGKSPQELSQFFDGLPDVDASQNDTVP